MNRTIEIVAGIAVVVLLVVGFVLLSQPKELPTSQNSPQPSASVFPTDAAITIESPQNESVINNPTITVRGRARVFENQFMIRVRATDNTILLEEPVTTDAPDAGVYGSFRFTFTLSKNILPSEKVYIDAFEYSAKDGSRIHMTTVGIYVTHQQTTTVRIYFPNSQLDQSMSCSKVFPLERVIPYTQAVGQTTLAELLKGPTQKETSLGYATHIPQGTTVKKLRIEKGVAYVDFSEQLDKNIAGSCTVSAIRSQITETLKQFPTVQEVIISVNGNSTEILQP